MSDLLQNQTLQKEKKPEFVVKEEQQRESLSTTSLQQEKNIGEEQKEGEILSERLSLKKEDVVPAEQINAGPALQIPKPKYKHIGFDKRYSKKEQTDGVKMAAIRSAMEEYFKSREIYDAATDTTFERRQKRFDEMLASLEELQKRCNVYLNRWIIWTPRGRTRAREVRAMRTTINAEVKRVQAEYVAYMDQRLLRKEADISTNRYYEEQTEKTEITVRKDNVLDFSKVKRTERSDWKNRTFKEHLLLRSEQDLARTDLSEEERTILTELQEYGRINASAAELTYGRHLGAEEEAKCKGDLERERTLYTRIKDNLDKVLSNEHLSEEKRAMFTIYRDRITEATSGTLVFPQKTKENEKNWKNFYLYEETPGLIYYNTDSEEKEEKVDDQGNKVTVYKKTEVDMIDRSDEPLFPHEPCLSDIAQTGYGNCFFLSTVAERVARDPNAIKSIMKDEGDMVLVKLNRRF